MHFLHVSYHLAISVHIVLLFRLDVSTAIASSKLQIHPVQIRLDDVSFQYPKAWHRQFLSAVPRRDYALQNVSLYLTSQLTVLTGNSDSGKSTILKMIHGDHRPTNGNISISTCRAGDGTVDAAHCQSLLLPYPLYLEFQPDRSDSDRPTRQIMMEKIRSYSLNAETEHAVACYLCQVLDFSERALQQTRFQLSTSDDYKFEILLACIESMLRNARQNDLPSGESLTPLPSPLLLLDEWLDKETSQVVTRLQDCLNSLARSGAVVCVVTHKPERWNLDQVNWLKIHKGKLLNR